VLEPAELALDRAALVEVALPPVGAPGNQRVQPAGLDPHRRGSALTGRAAPLARPGGVDALAGAACFTYRPILPRGSDNFPSLSGRRVRVKFVGNQDHLHDDAAQMASVWLCIVDQMACPGAG